LSFLTVFLTVGLINFNTYSPNGFATMADVAAVAAITPVVRATGAGGK
tara:strand:+ start:516 stop:659 length:144 start_codon:yes stop_codon:yes gene_type:complete